MQRTFEGCARPTWYLASREHATNASGTELTNPGTSLSHKMTQFAPANPIAVELKGLLYGLGY
jgi:hypothetical protein